MKNQDALGRKCTRLDPDIYLWQRNGERRLVVFIHGIFGGADATWGDFPQAVMSEHVFSDTAWTSWAYKSRIRDANSVIRVAQALVTFLRAHATDYSEVFFVCHSMGGLIARDACAQLANSGEEADHRLVQAIRLAVLLATPGAGSWMARILRRFGLGRLNARIEHLADPSRLHARLDHALARCREKGLSSPTFHWIDGESDGVVSHQSNYTTADSHAGIVPGGHSGLKESLGPNSTLFKTVRGLIVDSSAPPSADVGPTRREDDVDEGLRADGGLESVASDKSVRRIILIPCTAHKASGGDPYGSHASPLQGYIDNPEITSGVFRTRSRVRELLQKGVVDGVEFAEGNRASRVQNRALALGPDFGGSATDGSYLPAWQRYLGRVFQAGSKWDSATKLYRDEDAEFWVVSGLYGLLPIDEPIQNYDCHLTDLNTREAVRIVDYWRITATLVLNKRIEVLKRSGYQRIVTIDLLGEKSYQDAIKWESIQDAELLRGSFEIKRGRDCLEYIGEFLEQLLSGNVHLTELEDGYSVKLTKPTGSDVLHLSKVEVQ